MQRIVRVAWHCTAHGLGFLQNGFQASYKLEGLEFECFIVENGDGAEAEAAARQYLENFGKGGLEIEAAGPGSTFNDKYLHHVFVARVGRFLAGVGRIPDGKEELGRSYLDELVRNLNAEPRAPEREVGR